MGLGSQVQGQGQDQDHDHDQQTKVDVRAYENVKSRWIRDGVWDDDWTFVPGTSWRHERPRKALNPDGEAKGNSQRFHYLEATSCSGLKGDDKYGQNKITTT